MEISSYENLLTYLRQWRGFRGSSEHYDFVGMAHLLGACLDNLAKYGLPSDFEELSECLSESQARFLRKLATLLGEG